MLNLCGHPHCWGFASNVRLASIPPAWETKPSQYSILSCRISSHQTFISCSWIRSATHRNSRRSTFPWLLLSYSMTCNKSSILSTSWTKTASSVFEASYSCQISLISSPCLKKPVDGASRLSARKSMVTASRLCFSSTGTPSTGVMSPTSDSAISCTRAILVQWGMFKRDAKDGGASIVIIDIRYMWSEMDSAAHSPRRRHPSRFVVFRRSRKWKKAIGDVGFVGGGAGSLDSSAVGISNRQGDFGIYIYPQSRSIALRWECFGTMTGLVQ